MRGVQGKHLRPRILWVLSAAIFAGCLAAAADDAAGMRPVTALGPSKLDYMVLASMADSPHLLSFAGYRSAPKPCAPPPAGTLNRPTAGKKILPCRA
jgi:hypothetical protein